MAEIEDYDDADDMMPDAKRAKLTPPKTDQWLLYCFSYFLELGCLHPLYRARLNLEDDNRRRTP